MYAKDSSVLGLWVCVYFRGDVIHLVWDKAEKNVDGRCLIATTQNVLFFLDLKTLDMSETGHEGRETSYLLGGIF